MKKNISIIIAIIAFNMMVQAQEDPEIWMTYDLMPKKGMVKQFEAAAEKKNKKFNNTAETAIFTFKYMDGENQGKYQRVMGYKDWDFFNNQQQGDNAQQKYWAENVDQFVESRTGWKVWSRSLKHSHNWTPTTTFKHMYVLRRFIKPGHEAAVYNFLDRGAKVMKAHNYSGIQGVFQLMSGGNTNEYIICNGFDKFGEFGKYPDTEKTEAELYDEMFGQGSWRKDATAYNQSLEMYSRTTERLMSVEALSTQLN